MGGDQHPSPFQEELACGCQADPPWRAFEQAAAKTILKAFDLQAYCGLGRVQGLGGPSEADKISNQNKGLDGFQVERFHASQ